MGVGRILQILTLYTLLHSESMAAPGVSLDKFSAIQWNANSLTTKIPDLIDHISKTPIVPDMLIIQDTRFEEKKDYEIENYELFRGGGK